jgi:tyrosinase
MYVNRRKLLKLTGTSVATLSAASLFGGCEHFLEEVRKRPTRKNIATLANSDPVVEAYRAGVSAMRALPAGDLRNWTQQAQIHQNSCPHGNWYFLPWHRAYLYYFESIVRELSGYEDFALPYWNWTCQPSIPPHFFGAGNSLEDNTRTKGPTDSIPVSMTGADIIEDILQISDFENFGSFESDQLRGGTGGGYGELEGTPHNLVHGWIGGNMGNFMSPLDPVFWCHHNMIERLWWEWNITRGNPNPNAASWGNLSLAGLFCDSDGNPINTLNVATTALMPLLAYQFDDQVVPCRTPITDFSVFPRSKSVSDLEEFLKKGGPFRVKTLDIIKADQLQSVAISGADIKRISLPAAGKKMLLNGRTENPRYIIRVSNAKLENTNDIFVRLFINVPPGMNLREKDSIYYAGSFAFFGSGDHAQHHGGNTFHIDVTDTIERLRSNGLVRNNDDISISMAAVSIADGKSVPRGSVTLSNIEILLSDKEPQ